MHSRNERKIQYSLIIPTYNSMRFAESMKKITHIDKAIEEIVEIIFVDDGSVDGTYEFCQELADKRKWVRSFQIKHSGISKARNYGLEKSNGRFILFCDSDDLILINNIVSALICNPSADLTVFSYYHNDNGEISNGRIFEKESINVDNKEDFLYSNYKKIAGSVWNKVFLKEIIDKNNNHFVEESIIGNEDILFNLMYFCHCNTIQFIDEPLYYYTIRDDSVSKTKEIDIGIVKRFCSGVFCLEDYMIENDVVANDFLLYYLIKQINLSQRSFIECRDIKLEMIARFILESERINKIFKRSSEKAISFFVGLEKYNQERINAVFSLKKAVINNKLADVVNALDCILFA